MNMISASYLKRWAAALQTGVLVAGLGISALVGWYASSATGAQAGFAIFGLLGAITLAITALLAWTLRIAAREAARAGNALADAREGGQWFQELVELSSDWYWEQDEQFRFTHMSGGVFNKGGYRIDDSLGKTRWELPLHEPDAEIWRRHREQLERHEPFHDLRYRVRVADGSLRTYSISGRPRFDTQGRFIGYRGIGRDITAATAREEALRESEERFALVMAATADGIWDYDPRSNTTYFSPNFAGLLGYADTEALHRGFTFSEALHPEEREVTLAHMHAILESGGPFDETYRLKTAQGDYRWFRGRGRAIADESGKVCRFTGALTDIGEIKRAEEAVRALNADLDRRVKERTAELEASNRELEAFSYSASHDLRGPLRGIEGFAHILAEDYSDRLDATGRSHLVRIRQAAQRMAQLIDDILELARITRADLNRHETDLSALAQAAARELQEASARRVHFTIEPDLKARADPTLMSAALTNLLANAWKFTGNTPEARIEFTAISLNGKRVFCVRDNGAGFDPAYADKLFQPFQRLHRPDEFAGTGIGLAIVQRVIRRHGGHIWAESAPGQGAAFYFTLP